MGESTRILLETLHSLGEVDASLARIRAEVKALDQEIEEKGTALEQKKSGKSELESLVKGRKAKYELEEERLKEESQKLVHRRKALSTFNDYKTQQSAQKEIEQAAKQLSQQEEKLLSSLDGAEEEEQQLKTLTEEVEKLDGEYTKILADSEESLSALREQEQEKLEKRKGLVAEVPPKELTRYQRIGRCCRSTQSLPRNQRAYGSGCR